MKRLPINQAGTTIHIEDLPDAVKAILIEGPQAKRFADLALHRSDLQFADSCLAELMNVPLSKQLSERPCGARRLCISSNVLEKTPVSSSLPQSYSSRKAPER